MSNEVLTCISCTWKWVKSCQVLCIFLSKEGKIVAPVIIPHPKSHHFSYLCHVNNSNKKCWCRAIFPEIFTILSHNTSRRTEFIVTSGSGRKKKTNSGSGTLDMGICFYREQSCGYLVCCSPIQTGNLHLILLGICLCPSSRQMPRCIDMFFLVPSSSAPMIRSIRVQTRFWLLQSPVLPEVLSTLMVA